VFDLLTNILIWIIAIPVFIILFKAIPKEWFRLFGLIIFTALVAIIFANLKLVEEPIPKVVAQFLTFPFTITGILLLLLFFNFWLRLRDIKIKSGDKVDNKGAVDKVSTVSREMLIALTILAIASNNATSELFTCYLIQQGTNAVEQSYRRPVLNLTTEQTLDFQNGVYDIIVVLAENPPYNSRLQKAAEIWEKADINLKPLILLSGGKRTSQPPTKGYPCLIDPNLSQRNKTEIKDQITTRSEISNIGLRFDPRFENQKRPINSLEKVIDILEKTDLTEADQMCAALVSLPNIKEILPFIIIEPIGVTVRSSGDEINKLIKAMEKSKSLREDQNNSRRLLVITSPIEATRTFLSFRNQELNVALATINDPCNKNNQTLNDCPWPIGKKFQIKPYYFLFSAESLVQSERAWTEVKELIFYTLRFWLRPPLTDERPYFPKIETPK
jgi:hypothetical protein